MRLYWAGRYDCGGVLVAAPDRRTALRRAHDEICTCDERAECLRDGEWRAFTVESALQGHARIRLVHGGTHSADWRLWWGASEEDGEFVVARHVAEALALMSREYEDVTCIAEVDGYTVVVEMVGRRAEASSTAFGAAVCGSTVAPRGTHCGPSSTRRRRFGSRWKSTSGTVTSGYCPTLA